MSEVPLETQEPPETVCATPTYQDIHNLLTTCQRYGLLGAVVGERGTGKTTAAWAFAEPRRPVVYFRVSRAAAAMRHFLVRLNEALDGHWAREYSSDDFYRQILQNLYDMKQRGGLLILDEAQDLEPEAKDIVRNLYEDCGIGICLVGNKDLLAPDGKRSKAVHNVQRLLARIGPKLVLDKPMPKDIDALCAFHGIDGKESVKLVHKIATTKDHLHNFGGVLKVVRKENSQAPALSFDTLKDAAFMIGAVS